MDNETKKKNKFYSCLIGQIFDCYTLNEEQEQTKLCNPDDLKCGICIG